jgi:phage shock protein E
MKVYILIGIVALILFFLYRYAIDSPLRIDASEAKKSNFDVILDVRTDAEVSLLGSYPGAIHIPSTDIEREVEYKIPNKSKSILLYCNTGQRARVAAEKMVKLGYSNVRYIAGTYTTLF